MGRKCCIKIKKCKKSKSCSSSSSSSSCSSSSSSSSSCCPAPCPNPYNAAGSIAGTVADEVFAATTVTNLTNVTIATVSTYVGPTNVPLRRGKSKKCCPVYLTVSGNVINGTVEIVTATSNCYNATTSYTNPVTVALNTTTNALNYTATLCPNQAIAFVPNLSTDGASSMQYTYAIAGSNKCC